MKRLKKIASLMLAAAMAFTVTVSQAAAASAASSDNSKVSAARVWTGKADTSWFDKDNLKDSYDISTPEQLAGFSQLVTEAAHYDRFRGVTINLTNDIILNDTTGWENWEQKPPKNTWSPIGKIGNFVTGYCPFAGVFNGNGHTISGIYTDKDKKGGGLFTYISGAVICNLKIEKSVVISEGAVGALVSSCEGSYIDSVEVNNVKVYNQKYHNPTGGIVGRMCAVNFLVPLTYMTLTACGVFVNPLFFAGEKMNISSAMNNCKAVNVDLYSPQFYSAVGPLIGLMHVTSGIANSISVNCTVTSEQKAKKSGDYGSVCGAASTNDCIIKNCYSYGFKVYGRDGEAKDFKVNDSDRVKTVSKTTLQSQSLAKKLGEGYKYVKNGTPVLTKINRYKVKAVFNGTKLKLAWTSVSGAKNYKVYYKQSNGVYKELTTVTGTTATLKNIKKGSSYTFMIRAFYSDGTFADVDSGKFTVKA